MKSYIKHIRKVYYLYMLKYNFKNTRHNNSIITKNVIIPKIFKYFLVQININFLGNPIRLVKDYKTENHSSYPHIYQNYTLIRTLLAFKTMRIIIIIVHCTTSLA